MKDSTAVIGLIITAILIIGALGYGGWRVKRYFNYKFEYKDQVTKTVRELVKKECLNE